MTNGRVIKIGGKIQSVKQWRLILLIPFVLYFIFTTWKLDGGIVLGEPDEVTHWELMENFKKGNFWPAYSGGPWYYELPGLPFFGYLLSFLPGKFTPLRAFSLLNYWSLAVGLFLWGRWRRGEKFGILAAALWLLSPLAIFYGRLGVLDSGFVSFAFLSLLSLDYALKEKVPKWGILGGVFLAVSLYIKYSALIFVAAIGLYFLLDAVIRNRKTVSRSETFSIDKSIFLLLASCFILTFPVAFRLFWHDKFLFRLHLFTNLGFIFDDIRKISSTVTLFTYKWDIVWWLSWPIVFLAVVGIFWLVSKSRFPRLLTLLREYRIFAVTFALVLMALVRQAPFYPRYMLMTVPFFVLLGAFGLEGLGRIRGVEKEKRVIGVVGAIGVLAFFWFITVPAWKSTQNHLIEDACAFVQKDSGGSDPWVFTNYWPHFFIKASRQGKVSWISTDIRDAITYIPGSKRNSFQIIDEEGGYVLLEKRYSYFRALVTNLGKDQAQKLVKEKAKPIEFINSNSLNFPYYRERGNQVDIYKFFGK